ncbi:hypothetical protein RHGRI_013915 [Rhododendron griersonianum]|uniref:Uncharacterized protein n=1 Tax=Rhododendron griersonianum TaxID=479676 RepID=A0AAV6K7P2_9ERIC|nr:hypothetical protein RHGRI_013915 [Rhododendron griersonianum]
MTRIEKVRQRKDAMEKSLIGSISTLFDAKKQKSLLSSQVEEESDEEFGEEDVNDNLRDKDVNEEASGANKKSSTGIKRCIDRNYKCFERRYCVFGS